MEENFQQRLGRLFDNASMAVIARRLGIPHATVRNYFGGRLPSPDVLIKIANETNASINWLLTGTGEMYAQYSTSPDALGKLFDRRIEEVVERKLAERFAAVGEIQELGVADAAPDFDIEKALLDNDDPHGVMSEWFKFDGRQYPQDYGVIFFRGWESFSFEEKLDAVRDAKKVLDRSLRSRT